MHDGAVSDWVNMGETSRLRAWLLAMAVAIAGVLILETIGGIDLSVGTFPPYRTATFAWPRYLVGGLMFGAGMTLASGCGYKTLVRIGGGNLKSLVVLAVASIAAYLMMWTDFFNTAFGWLTLLSIDLGRFGIKAQTLDGVVGAMVGIGANSGLHLLLGTMLVLLLAGFVFASGRFRRDANNITSGLVIGGAVAAGWYLTAGPLGAAWKEWAEMADKPPSRVEMQSFTFISPMGDLIHYLRDAGNFWFINFGIMALSGVILGSFLHAIASKRFRLEWFASGQDFVNHLFGALLMGFGGVLAMGCTVGQGITGVSTLSLGSMLATASIVAGCSSMMKYQYWMIMREA